MIVREAEKSDARGILTLLSAIDSETDQMLFEPGERKTSLAQQETTIEEFERDERSLFLVAEAECIVGFCVVVPGTLARNRHVASLVIGVRQSFCSQGVGSQLIEQSLEWANDTRIRRIELTVRADNGPAIGLYAKYGFVKEGDRVHSLYVGGEFKDEA